MQKIDKFKHAAKGVIRRLPPLVMSLIGLAALSRRKGGPASACMHPELRPQLPI